MGNTRQDIDKELDVNRIQLLMLAKEVADRPFARIGCAPTMLARAVGSLAQSVPDSEVIFPCLGGSILSGCCSLSS